VGNKSDLPESRQVSTQEGLDLANQLKVQFVETSAKSADNIEKCFMMVSKEVVGRLKVQKG
jgi:GTPase SAR1 family protein